MAAAGGGGGGGASRMPAAPSLTATRAARAGAVAAAAAAVAATLSAAGSHGSVGVDGGGSGSGGSAGAAAVAGAGVTLITMQPPDRVFQSSRTAANTLDSTLRLVIKLRLSPKLFAAFQSRYEEVERHHMDAGAADASGGSGSAATTASAGGGTSATTTTNAGTGGTGAPAGRRSHGRRQPASAPDLKPMIVAEVLHECVLVEAVYADFSIPLVFRQRSGTGGGGGGGGGGEEGGEEGEGGTAGHMDMLARPTAEVYLEPEAPDVVVVSIMPRTLPISSTHQGRPFRLMALLFGGAEVVATEPFFVMAKQMSIESTGKPRPRGQAASSGASPGSADDEHRRALVADALSRLVSAAPERRTELTRNPNARLLYNLADGGGGGVVAGAERGGSGGSCGSDAAGNGGGSGGGGSGVISGGVAPFSGKKRRHAEASDPVPPPAAAAPVFQQAGSGVEAAAAAIAAAAAAAAIAAPVHAVGGEAPPGYLVTGDDGGGGGMVSAITPYLALVQSQLQRSSPMRMPSSMSPWWTSASVPAGRISSLFPITTGASAELPLPPFATIASTSTSTGTGGSGTAVAGGDGDGAQPVPSPHDPAPQHMRHRRTGRVAEAAAIYSAAAAAVSDDKGSVLHPAPPQYATTTPSLTPLWIASSMHMHLGGAGGVAGAGTGSGAMLPSPPPGYPGLPDMGLPWASRRSSLRQPQLLPAYSHHMVAPSSQPIGDLHVAAPVVPAPVPAMPAAWAAARHAANGGAGGGHMHISAWTMDGNAPSSSGDDPAASLHLLAAAVTSSRP